MVLASRRQGASVDAATVNRALGRKRGREIRPVAGKGVQKVSVCKGCGAPIGWIRTTEGRNMPVDPEPVFIIEGGGTDRFVTDEGAVVLGRVARPDEESTALPVGFVPHWKTCPNAADFRRRR
jgi:hypothetical protein